MPRAEGIRWSQRAPSRWISPDVTSSRPAIMRSRVDLPQPDGPTRTVNEPSSTTRSMPWMTSSRLEALADGPSVQAFPSTAPSRETGRQGGRPAFSVRRPPRRTTSPSRPASRPSTVTAPGKPGRPSCAIVSSPPLTTRLTVAALQLDLTPAASGRPEIDAVAGTRRAEADLAFRAGRRTGRPRH